MRFFLIIFFLFAIDFYFYKATSLNKILSNTSLIGFIYWSICIFIYVFIIYVIINLEKGVQTSDINNYTVITSLIMIFFISKFFGSIPLLIDDMLRGFRLMINLFSSKPEFDNSRLDFLKISGLFISGILASTLMLGMSLGRYNFKKYFKNIKIKGWDVGLNDYKIIHISDLHLGSFNSIEKLEEVVTLVNSENPDLVVFTGDLVNNYYHEAKPYIDVLMEIKAKDGKFSILGNHDYGDYTPLKRSSKEWQDNFNNMIKIQKEIGFDLLLNESRLIKSEKGSFNLVGVENWGKGNFSKDGDLKSATNNLQKDIPTILLSHDPSHWKEQVIHHTHFIDLQLSGHTHGMQFGIEIPGIKWSPIQFRYKEWAGLYQKGKHQIYVNRGLGHLGYAGRVGIMPDISILNIQTL